MIRDNLIETIHEMEEVTKLFKLEPFDIYIIGGSACVLGEYTNRATLDVDFIDLGYPSKYGKQQLIFKKIIKIKYTELPLIESKKNNFIRANNLHYATIMEYKSRSNFNKNMIEQKKQKQRISEIRPVDNLILSSYYPIKTKTIIK